MRIDSNNGNTPALGQTAGTSQTEIGNSTAKPGTSSSPASDADGLQLSSFAGSLSRIMQSDSASRADRVAQLTAAVRSGTYQVDPQAVSRAIVDHIVTTSQSAQ